MLKKLLLALAVLAAPLAVAACQVPGTDTKLESPLVEGASFQQNAYAVLAAYAEAAEEVAEIVEDAATPEPVKTTLATVTLNVAPLAAAVTDAVAAYDAKSSEIKAMKDAGTPIAAIVFTEAGDLYRKAKALWDEHGDLLTSFPGLVKSVKQTGAAPAQ